MSARNTTGKVQDNPFVPYERPVELGRWEAFSKALWNPKEGTVLGRTGLSWGKILSFYVIFYCCLACLFGICMQGLFLYVNDAEPFFQLDDSLIGSNPGLGFRPIAENVDVEGSLVWYNANSSQTQTWVSRLDQFLEPYRQENGVGTNQKNCDYGTVAEDGKVCKVDLKKFGPCTSENSYGFNQSSPCIFLKLNKIYGWRPDAYTDLENLPAMPQDLKDHIKNSSAETLDTVWLSCAGENPADRENIGSVRYYPQQGFPGYYFPFMNNEGYLSPLVAVHFENPAEKVLINIECRAWSKNIFYSNHKGIREGSVHFELLID